MTAKYVVHSVYIIDTKVTAELVERDGEQVWIVAPLKTPVYDSFQMHVSDKNGESAPDETLPALQHSLRLHALAVASEEAQAAAVTHLSKVERVEPPLLPSGGKVGAN